MGTQYTKLILSNQYPNIYDNVVYSDMGFLKPYNGNDDISGSIYRKVFDQERADVQNSFKYRHDITLYGSDSTQCYLRFIVFNNDSADYNYYWYNNWASMCEHCTLENSLIWVDKSSCWNNKAIYWIEGISDWGRNYFIIKGNNYQTTLYSSDVPVYYGDSEAMWGVPILNNNSTLTIPRRYSFNASDSTIVPGVGTYVTAGMWLSRSTTIQNLDSSSWKTFNSDGGLLELVLTTGADHGIIRLSGTNYSVNDHLILQSELEYNSTNPSENYGDASKGHTVAHLRAYVGSHNIIDIRLAVKHSRRDSFLTPQYTDWCFVKKYGRLVLQCTVRADAQTGGFYYFEKLITSQDLANSKTLYKLADISPDERACNSSFLLNPFDTDASSDNYIIAQKDPASTTHAGYFDYYLYYKGHKS